MEVGTGELVGTGVVRMTAYKIKRNSITEYTIQKARNYL